MRVRAYVDAGRPIVALRTASHGFQNYLQFDADVLGGNYKGHFGNGPTTEVGVTPTGRAHPVLEGVGPLRSRYSLYKT
ncbi:MAG TPA: nicotinamidase, partial [Candidatus Hydrogenedentes bacterium]|nr:nicotinamidase [Candidatus Hydrogenedentota bacterium]